jgi:GNAT superfamily N-acetyltransferase
MSTGPVVRRALPDERSEVAATVAAAFAQDPGWGFIFGDEYERLAGDFAAALFDVRIASQSVWVTGDLAAVAMWDPPGKGNAAPGSTEAIWARYRAIAGEDACGRLDSYNDAVSAVAPAEPYWYLGVLATLPGRRREGLATAMLRPVLEAADHLGIACCLETSTADNRRFYERRDFTAAAEILLPGGPPSWWLRRAPGPPARG